MKPLFAALLLSASLASAPAAAEEALEMFTARTTGELVIDADGSVAEVRIEPRQLGEDVIAGFENQARQWRFTPIEIDGQPVRARAKMQLGLAIFRQPGVEGLRLAFQEVRFTEADGTPPPRDAAHQMAPPQYPRDQLQRRVGGRVNLVLRLDAEGKVLDAAAESVLLQGDEIGQQSARHAKGLGRAAEVAAKRWRIPGIDGGIVRVPVTFNVFPGSSERWVRTEIAPVEVPEWVAAARKADAVEALGDDGSPSSERFRPVTPIEG